MLTSLAKTFYFFTETLTSFLEKLQNVPKINDPKPSNIQRPDDKVVIYIRIKDMLIMIKVKLSDTVYGIKSAILAASGILPIQQDLRFAGCSLEDNQTISDYGIKNGYTIQLIIVFPISIPNPKMIDFKHNLDFTNMKDEGKVFMRGGWVYKRPYGWNKLALNIKDKYPDTAWLGGTEGLQRTNAVKGEWPVSYHGTNADSALKIATEGYDLKKGKS